MTLYNIYYGTIGKDFGEKYRITKKFRNDESALAFARECATSFYYKNEGKRGIPSFKTISEESKITGVSLEELYKEHIEDFMRYHVIPTELDTVSSSDLVW